MRWEILITRTPGVWRQQNTMAGLFPKKEKAKSWGEIILPGGREGIRKQLYLHVIPLTHVDPTNPHEILKID